MSNKKTKRLTGPSECPPPQPLAQARDFLQAEGVEGFVVGGYPRDCLLGRLSADIDIAVAAPALDIARKFAQATGGRFVGLDEAHAVARVVLSQGQGMVDFSTLRGSLEEDLASRDFTINAMAIGMGEVGGSPLTIIDPWGGRQDIEHRVIRAVSPQAFSDDPARLLRGLRLAAEYGFHIEPGTEELIHHSAHLVSRVPGERVREELVRLLALPHTAPTLDYLDSLGLLQALLPELGPARGCAQPPEHHWDVFTHSLKTVEYLEALLGEERGSEVLALAPWSEHLAEHFGQAVSATPRQALLKLAGLLHDIAKPQTKSLEAGRIRFLGHGQEGAAVAVAVLERWRFSRREIDLVERMVRYHLRPAQMAQGDEMPTHRAIYRYFRDTGEAGLDTLFLSLADHWATRGPQLSLEGWAEHTRIVKYILEVHFQEESVIRPPKLVDGHDLMAIFGLKPGPALGHLLEALREAQAAGEVATREEALDWVKGKLAEHHQPKTEEKA